MRVTEQLFLVLHRACKGSAPLCCLGGLVIKALELVVLNCLSCELAFTWFKNPGQSLAKALAGTTLTSPLVSIETRG